MNSTAKKLNSSLTIEKLKNILGENKIPSTKIDYFNHPLNCTLSYVDILDDEKYNTILISNNLLDGLNKEKLMLARIKLG